MPRLTRLITRNMGPFKLALTAYGIWRRIPPRHRRMLIAEARKHGPRLAKAAAERRRKRKR
jgi:hypothetical protein